MAEDNTPAAAAASAGSPTNADVLAAASNEPAAGDGAEPILAVADVEPGIHMLAEAERLAAELADAGDSANANAVATVLAALTDVRRQILAQRDLATGDAREFLAFVARIF
ncbi:hypothetical protein GCM10007036_14250 [Alsobacter metallidurans]|uniref:Uncharacterized protein n=1 Tax=Alsobacter metallidurans TaxID=340221 RepID=A0A917I5Y4_9HYPH|nr:hypothetical protein [Alsobacter metallidurans]GGH14740.1 hypothetical protein GCM10007036_14250 [Alsobacter metallidurans]